jgi:Polyketide cyclase / dehydrase and lipid transport
MWYMYRVVRHDRRPDVGGAAMFEQTISKRAWTAASASEVYALLRDGATWPVWSPLESFRLEQEGPEGGESLGAIRVFTTGRATSREEIVVLDPDRTFGYALLSGLPLNGYRALVDLVPRDGGTEIHWHSTFRAKLPGTGGLYRRFLGAFIQKCVDGLAAHTTADFAEASEHTAPA